MRNTLMVVAVMVTCWAGLSACQREAPERVAADVDRAAAATPRAPASAPTSGAPTATPAAKAIGQVETIAFIDRLNSYTSVAPQGTATAEGDIERVLAAAAAAGELTPLMEKGRPAGPRLSAKGVIHTDKAVIFGRVGDEDGEPFGLGEGDSLEVTRTADPRVLEALTSSEPAESLGPCRRGACPVALPGGSSPPLWVAVRVEGDREYLAGWFPDEGFDAGESNPGPHFDAWLAQLEASWGPADAR